MRFPMPFTLAEYNSSVASVNETLRNRCQQLNGITFWRHARLHNGSLFCHDGVHLNVRGERRLLNSLRGALRATETERKVRSDRRTQNPALLRATTYFE